jgi:hypothetical protein
MTTQHTPEIEQLTRQLTAARAEAFAYGRCCDLYQDAFGQFHCKDCGQKTFAMLRAVQEILSDGTEPTINHEESLQLALIRKAAPETARQRDELQAALTRLAGIASLLANYTHAGRSLSKEEWQEHRAALKEANAAISAAEKEMKG